MPPWSGSGNAPSCLSCLSSADLPGWSINTLRAVASLYSSCEGHFPGGASGKEPTSQYRRCKRLRFDPWVREIPWRRAWQPTPVFMPGESHGPRSLAGYSPWGRKESDTTERLTHNAKSAPIINAVYKIQKVLVNLDPAHVSSDRENPAQAAETERSILYALMESHK